LARREFADVSPILARSSTPFQRISRERSWFLESPVVGNVFFAITRTIPGASAC